MSGELLSEVGNESSRGRRKKGGRVLGAQKIEEVLQGGGKPTAGRAKGHEKGSLARCGKRGRTRKGRLPTNNTIRDGRTQR